MQTKHTPGPWVYRQSFDSAARRDIWTATDATGHRELVATIPDAEGDHINANARLIAAAPDMIDALHSIDEFCQQGLNSPEPAHWEAALQDIMGLTRAAIAKATGAA